MQTDPYSQFASPYVGMGNGPDVGVDPDGGFVEGLIFKSLFLELGIVVAGGALYGGISGQFNDNRGVSALIGAGIFLGGYGVGRWGVPNIPWAEFGSGLGNIFNNADQILASTNTSAALQRTLLPFLP